MTKMDDMRAMREARYDAPRRAAVTPTGAPDTPPAVPHRAKTVELVPETAQAGRCGHRAISGRTCTRDAGHAAKSHRYS